MTSTPHETDLQTSTTTDNGWTIVAITGEFDTYAAGKVRDQLTDVIAASDPPRVVVDLTGVAFMDSSALGVLVGALRTSRALDGEIRLACTPEHLTPLFRITGLNRTFDIFGTIAEATAAPPTEPAA